MAPRWPGKGPDARRRAEAYQPKDTLRPDNAADGPFPGHPPKSQVGGDVLFASPRRRSSSPYAPLDTTRRRSLMRGENHVVAGSLASHTRSKLLMNLAGGEVD